MSKSIEYVLLALSIVFLIIGIDQTIKGFSLKHTYSFYMFSVYCLLGVNLLKLQKKSVNLTENSKNKPDSKSNSSKPKSKKK